VKSANELEILNSASQKIPGKVDINPFEQDDEKLQSQVNKFIDFIGTESSTVRSTPWAVEFSQRLDRVSLKALFRDQSWVYILTNKLARMASSVVPYVHRDTPTSDGTVDTEMVLDHPVQMIIDNPSDIESAASWRYRSFVEFYLGGNGVLAFFKNTGKFVVLPFQLIDIQLDYETGAIESYDLYADAFEIGVGKPSQSYPLEDIIHFQMPSPYSVYWGHAPFLSARKELSFNRFSMDHMIAYFAKGTKPSLVVKTMLPFDDEKFTRLQTFFENAWAGRPNQQKLMILPKGYDVEPILTKLADSSVREHLEYNRETIIQTLDVPKHALSIQSVGSLGNKEIEFAIKFLWSNRIIPDLAIRDDAFTRFFKQRGLLEENEYIKTDLSQVSELQEDEQEKADLAKKKLDSGKSVNEVRTEIYECDPIEDNPDADTPFVLLSKSGQAEQGVNLAPFFSATQPEAQKELSAKVEENHESKELDDRQAKMGRVFMEKNKEKIQKTIQDMDEHEETVSKGVLKDTLDLFGDFAEDTFKEMDSRFKARSKDRATERALLRRYRRRRDAYLEQYKQRLQDTTDFGFSTQVDLAPNADIAAAIDGLRAESESDRLELLEARGRSTFDSVSETTAKEISNKIAKELEKPEGTVQTASAAIREYFTDNARMRADRIARTETLTAMSLGQASAIEETTELIPDLKKQWIHTGDVGTNPDAREAHFGFQQAGPIDAKAEFGRGLSYPRDVNASPNETISCRCTMALVSPEDLDLTEDLQGEEA